MEEMKSTGEREASKMTDITFTLHTERGKRTDRESRRETEKEKKSKRKKWTEE